MSAIGKVLEEALGREAVIGMAMSEVDQMYEERCRYENRHWEYLRDGGCKDKFDEYKSAPGLGRSRICIRDDSRYARSAMIEAALSEYIDKLISERDDHFRDVTKMIGTTKITNNASILPTPAKWAEES